MIQQEIKYLLSQEVLGKRPRKYILKLVELGKKLIKHIKKLMEAGVEQSDKSAMFDPNARYINGI